MSEKEDTASIDQLAIRVGSGVTPTGGSDVYVDSGVIFIRSQNVTNSGLLLDDVAFIDDETHQRMSASAVYPFDVLLNITGASIGRCCFAPEGLGPANVNQHVCAIRLAKPNLRDAQFLSAALASDVGQSQIWRLNAGGNREGLNYRQLRSLRVPWPDKHLRVKIANILSTRDETIQQTEALIAKYQQIREGLMQDLFTRGVTLSGRLRPTPAQAAHLYRETPLGWIPRDWDCVATEDRICVIDPQPDHRTPPEVSEGYPYIGIGDLATTGEVMFNKARQVSKSAFVNQLQSFDIDPGAFIFGKIGSIGSPTRIPHDRFFALSANVVLLTAKVRAHVDFMFWFYNSNLIARQIADATNTTSQPALGIKTIRKLLAVWPSSELERAKIVSYLEASTKRYER